ncbi:MAG TPA: hypothetical protein PL042_01700 [Caldisericia bacterium]|nr:hypothetical protein [Caldisericia bacterium]
MDEDFYSKPSKIGKAKVGDVIYSINEEDSFATFGTKYKIIGIYNKHYYFGCGYGNVYEAQDLKTKTIKVFTADDFCVNIDLYVVNKLKTLNKKIKELEKDKIFFKFYLNMFRE